MNVVYVKHFENGKKYVGATNNFKRRMQEHNKRARRGDTAPLYIAMRKYEHETEIVFESENYDEVLKYERIIIRNFKDLGYELYNLTEGGDGTLGYKHTEETRQKLREANLGRFVGENNPMYGKTHTDEVKKMLAEIQKGQKSFRAKPMEYYETNATRRDKFKRTCQRMGWNYDNFEEVETDEVYVSPKGCVSKKYYYIYRGEDYIREMDWSKTNIRPVEYYEYTPTLRSVFKEYCERHNLNFDDFEEIFSGEYRYYKSGSKIGKYFYIYKYKESEIDGNKEN